MSVFTDFCCPEELQSSVFVLNSSCKQILIWRAIKLAVSVCDACTVDVLDFC